MKNTQEVNETIQRINELIGKLPANVVRPQPIKLLRTQPAEIDRTVIATLLTHHSVCRKDQQWPLIPLEDMIAVKRLVIASGRPIVKTSEVLQVGSCHAVNLYEATPIETLRKCFLLMERILMMAPGSVAVAGGAVYKALCGFHLDNDTDLDVFFHSMTYEDAEIKLKAFILQIIKENPGLVYVTRNAMVTTMYVRTEDQRAEFFWEGKKYQFVHRVYPNKSCIIGGFDLDCSAVLYDGHEIYGTPLFTFTYSREILLADLSRLSTSHADRVRKYLRYGRLQSMLFTTTTSDEIKRSLEHSVVEIKACNMWIGGGLSARISEVVKGQRGIYMNSKTFHRDDGTIVDYEAYDNADRDMARANTQMLLRKNFTCVKWGGTTEQEIFQPIHADIKLFDQEAFNQYIVHYDIKSITAAVRWLPYDEVNQFKGIDRWTAEQQIKALFTDERVNRLIADAESNLQSVKLGPQWLAPDDNPGRQFTSSFHPIDDVIGWYNPKLYRPFKIGVQPNIWATVRCAQKRRDGDLGILTRDCVIVIFRCLWRLIGEDGMRIALCM